MNLRASPPLLLSVAAALALAAPGSALAQAAAGATQEKEAEEGGARRATLEDRIPPVSGNLFLKKGRFEVSPTLGMSLADAFFQKYAAGLKLTFHPLESLSFGAHVSYAALNTPGSAITVCRLDGCRQPTLDDLKDVPGRIGLIAGGEAAWSPLYGKVNVLAEKVLHFDFSVLAGVSAIQYQQPAGKMGMGVGGHLGVGQRYFLTRNMTLRIELRDYIYSAQTVPLGKSSSKIENQLMLDLGLSFFIGKGPTE